MRVIFDHPDPFLLFHGGFQIQIEQTLNALRDANVDVEYLRWWDDRQSADIIHYFGRPPLAYVDQAQKKGIRVVMAQLLTGLGSRSRHLLPFQRVVITAARSLLPRMVTARFAWDVFKKVDAAVALTPWEGRLMNYMFGAPKEKVHVVGNGVEQVFLKSKPAARSQWLVCTATVTERKRVLELAEAAVLAQTPLWIIGKPYAESDPYAQRFMRFIRQNSQTIRYEGAISDRNRLAGIYREARGFVLLSTMESLSLSALEAAACECPLLLSDLPWARTTFNDDAAYCSIASPRRTSDALRRFYDTAPKLKIPSTPPSWDDIAKQLTLVYQHVLKT